MIRPHDLLWIKNDTDMHFMTPPPTWIKEQWTALLPVVVRRDRRMVTHIPVGVRGLKRSERTPAWVKPSAIVRTVPPESLISPSLCTSPFISLPPLRALMALQAMKLPWCWGVTGSCGYALTTGLSVLHPQSDLDIMIRSSRPIPLTELKWLAAQIKRLECRIDIQIETVFGAFALMEWVREKRVLLKTSNGPLITKHPWSNPRGLL